RTAVAFARLRLFIAVKLQNVQRYRAQHLLDFLTPGIDEQPHRCNERWQGRDNGARLLWIYRARAFCIEHQPDGIRTGLCSQQGIRDAGDTANLAANDRQKKTRLKMSRMLTKGPPAASVTDLFKASCSLAIQTENAVPDNALARRTPLDTQPVRDTDHKDAR